ncbi:terminase small subunit [Sphingobium sp. RSMS]|uniref:terminase small subunit n=1 Tax=Sphingobium sp. RSMS TaxID=520734 RepID=UPI0010F9EFEA|nr:terminase small subunit [Sphingobium sp. RSMS]UXC93117.1 terminase small subunit [Sphingobium sp. RSMS]
MAKLDGKQARFVEEYLVDLNATAAYRRAGYVAKGNSAEVNASRLLRNAKVQRAIAAAQQALSERTQITQEMVLRRWWEIATADPNELIQFRRTCCRHCHGDDFGYQWIDTAEFRKAVAAAAMVEDAGPQDMPSDEGGYGFDKKADPHPDCPKCGGEGREDIHALDTRHLKGPARLLYAGAKITKEGFEIKLQDQGKALENVARHLGMFKDKVEHDITDDLAAAIIAGNARVNNGRQ